MLEAGLHAESMVLGSHVGVLLIYLQLHDGLFEGRMVFKFCGLGPPIDILDSDCVILYDLFIKFPGGKESFVLLHDELSELAYFFVVFSFQGIHFGIDIDAESIFEDGDFWG